MALVAYRRFIGVNTVTYVIRKAGNAEPIGHVLISGRDYICRDATNTYTVSPNAKWIGTVVIAQMSNRNAAIVAARAAKVAVTNP